MRTKQQQLRGFTIVELLIVIVVIAILATISIVAYNGIQNRANDSAIQSDLNNFSKKIQLAAATTDEFPAGGASRTGGINTGDSTAFTGFTFKPSKNAYMSTESNLYYCTGTEASSGQKIFRILARSKSGNLYSIASNSGIQNIGNVSASLVTVCQGLSDPHTWSYGYYSVNGTWWSWTSG
jgi:prepilin-type N-terminal cleavage/methylation domain-containing protein